MYKLKQDIIFFDPLNNVNIWYIINSLLKYAKYLLVLIPYNF